VLRAFRNSLWHLLFWQCHFQPNIQMTSTNTHETHPLHSRDEKTSQVMILPPLCYILALAFLIIISGNISTLRLAEKHLTRIHGWATLLNTLVALRTTHAPRTTLNGYPGPSGWRGIIIQRIVGVDPQSLIITRL
jgi:hypothetical protein